MNVIEQTVGMTISRVLPFGSLELPADLISDDPEERCAFCPMFPTDVFAVAGTLVKTGGVISFFEPSPYAAEDKLQNCHFMMTRAERRLADIASAKWRDPEREDRGEPPDTVQRLWGLLIDAWEEPVTPGYYLSARNGAPQWWWAAVMLVTISDMACNRLLRDPIRSYKPSPFEEWVSRWYLDQRNPTGSEKDDEDDSGQAAVTTPPASLCQVADSAVVCVLPKVRVSPVGAALRNLSRNLSLLPGRGEVRCSWIVSPAIPRSEDVETLDILLIPEPVRLNANDFEAHGDDGVTVTERHYYKRDWETFSIQQNWLYDGDEEAEDDLKVGQFLQLCKNLLLEAKKQSRAVNGVILPEYALTFSVFEKLCSRLKACEPKLEFLIAGSSDNCEARNGKTPEPGNHVLTRVWYDADKHVTTSRRKHHRWRLDRSQVEAYSLSTALNPKIKFWWEDSPLGRRELHFLRFRKRSVFSVLICEELARSEPCHEILRAVAPNLIFALLMDGPQIRERWPAQYAANLADDPGSSVLTFTSYGLINRANAQGHYSPNHSIALWKDDTGKVVQIEMPKDSQNAGVLLSLWSEHVVDRTITGKNSEVRSWRYSSHFPVSL